MSAPLLYYCELDGWFNAIEVVQEWDDERLGKGCKGVIIIALSEAWGAREALQGSLFHILHHQLATTTDTGDPIVVPCTCLYTFPLKDKKVATRHRVKRPMMSSTLRLVCSGRKPSFSNLQRATWTARSVGTQVNREIT